MLEQRPPWRASGPTSNVGRALPALLEGHSNPRRGTMERTETAQASITIKAAKAYFKIGMKPIPIAPGEKRPRSLEWQRGVFADTAEIARHWEQHPDDGVGLVAGEQSGWFVLDVDVKAGGVESLDALVDEYGALPDTV